MTFHGPEYLGVQCSPSASHLHSVLVAGARTVLPNAVVGEMPLLARFTRTAGREATFTEMYRKTLIEGSNGLRCVVTTSCPDPVMEFVLSKGQYGEPPSFGTWVEFQLFLGEEMELDLCWSSQGGWYMSDAMSVVGAGFLKDLALATGYRPVQQINALVEQAPVVEERWLSVDLQRPTRSIGVKRE